MLPCGVGIVGEERQEEPGRRGQHAPPVPTAEMSLPSVSRSTGTGLSRPARTSARTARRESTATPTPSRIASLIASPLPSSSTTLSVDGSVPARSSDCSKHPREADPRSRWISGWAAKSAGETRFFRHGCRFGTTRTNSSEVSLGTPGSARCPARRRVRGAPRVLDLAECNLRVRHRHPDPDERISLPERCQEVRK